MRHASSFALYLLCGLCMAALAQAPLPTQRIRGDVAALDGLNLQIKSRAGEMLAVKLAENYLVTAVAKTDVTAIKPGTFVGIASMPQPDGTQLALEVLLFPESMRGSNEGHYPWDLKPGSMMTNATVADAVAMNPGGRRMTLKYKDGEKTIVVPDDAPIVPFVPDAGSTSPKGVRAPQLAATAVAIPRANIPSGRM